MMLCRKFWLQIVASGCQIQLSSEIEASLLVRSLSGGVSGLSRASGFLSCLYSFRLDNDDEDGESVIVTQNYFQIENKFNI